MTASTANPALYTFYDIESLANVFSLCAYTPAPADSGLQPALDVYALIDDRSIAENIRPSQLNSAIRHANPAMPADTRITLHNLGSLNGTEKLAKLIGVSTPNQLLGQQAPTVYADDYRLVCDTDPEYDPGTHPYLLGYNSANYDTVMLALYLMETGIGRIGVPFASTTAAAMREHNDKLFSDRFRSYMPGYLTDHQVTDGDGWDSPQSRLRQAMLMTGRHLDVARLNEAQSRVSLKRLLGMLGHQILESDKLSSHNDRIEDTDGLYELLAYNTSDCVGLSKLFEHPTYAGAFELKKSLLETYAETRYVTGQPQTPAHVRRDRLSIDSSSAKFVGRILCPDGHLDDIETVSFDYPSQRVADETGVPRINVLQQCVRFFEDRVTPDRDTNPDQARAHARFMDVVKYYRSIEGKNFNDSPEYANTFDFGFTSEPDIDPATGTQRMNGDVPAVTVVPYGPHPQSLASIAKTPNNLPYFHADGTPSTCFATFSIGGIHGAEFDDAAHRADQAVYQNHCEQLKFAREHYPDATDFLAAVKTQHNTLHLSRGECVDKRLVLLGSDPTTVRYRKPKKDDPVQMQQLAAAQASYPDPADLLATQRPPQHALQLRNAADGALLADGKIVLANSTEKNAAYRDQPVMHPPLLFEPKSDGSTKLRGKYTYTSAAHVMHEDFTSYYPNLLRNMAAFYNPKLGEDRYANIFAEKERLGTAMKQAGLPKLERDRLATLRNGTKLILNAASGAGDAAHKTPIRMNNQIISMRIIGQLFSWLIAQAQTLAGGTIVSTNTDGLYSALDPDAGFDAELNNTVLREQSAAINVEIEPEPMFLVSKDSNNRLELVPPPGGSPDLPLDQWEIHSASGGTLACHAGPRPDKSLAHPAVIDHVLVQYLQFVAQESRRDPQAFTRSFLDGLGRILIERARMNPNRLHAALLFQTMVTASPGSITYPFAAEPMTSDDNEISNPVALQHVNRAFIVRPGTPGAKSLHNACARVVNPATKAKRQREGLPAVETKPIARKILEHNGWARDTRSAQQRGALLLPTDQDVVVRKITSIDPSWPVLIRNEDLHGLDDLQLKKLLDALDLDVYTAMVRETYEKNWRNRPIADGCEPNQAAQTPCRGNESTQEEDTHVEHARAS